MFDNSAEVLDLRPKKDTKNMELFKSIHKSQHVQRNFDLSKKMPEQDIATIVTAATQSPSKQNVAHFKVHAITNREVIEEIYECTTCNPDSSPEASGLSYARGFYKPGANDLAPKEANYPENPQVLGNLVLVFEESENYHTPWDKLEGDRTHCANPQTFVTSVEEVRHLFEGNTAMSKIAELPKDEKKRVLQIIDALERQGVDVYNKDSLDKYITKNREILTRDRNQALGIALGYVNLSSAQLGYGTGCCTCIMDQSRLQKLLGMEGGPMIVMGIGYKQEGKNRRVHQYRDDFVFPTRKKQEIEVNYVN